MTNYDYSYIERLDNSVTKKLVNYINKDPDIDYIFINKKGIFPLIENPNFRLPYTMWLCCDYKDGDNNYYIDKLIADDKNLTKDEVSILMDKKDSYVSIFRIKAIKGLKTIVFDHILKKEYILEDYFHSNSIKINDFIIGRIGKLLGKNKLIGEINFVNKSVLNNILRLIIKDLNTKNIKHTKDSMFNYLKNESLSVYSYYLKSSLDYLEGSEDYLPPIYSELESFKGYLNNKKDPLTIDSYLKALWEINGFYLNQKNIEFDEIYKMDLKDFFNYSIMFRFISNKDEFRVFYNALKEFLIFKHKQDNSLFNNKIEMIKSIGESSFKYIDSFKEHKILSELDFYTSRLILESINDQAVFYIDDFNTMLYQVIEHDGFELTPKKGFIKLYNMERLITDFNGEYNLLFSVPKRMKYPIIDLFYNIGLNMGLFKLREGILKLAEGSDDYFLISDSNKLWNHLKVLFHNRTIETLLGLNGEIIPNFRDLIFEVLHKCPVFMVNDFDIFNNQGFELDHIMLYIRYLAFMGLVSQDSYYGKISLTPLGETLLPLLDKLDQSYDSNVFVLK